MASYWFELTHVSYFHVISIFSIYSILGLFLKFRFKSILFAGIISFIHIYQIIIEPRYFLLDDQTYLNYAKSMYFGGFDYFNFYDQDFVGLKFVSILSRHFGYYLNVVTSMKIWGPFYTSPLILNHFFFALSSFIFSKILIDLDLNKKWVLLFILHPFYNSWLQINIKGFFVSFLILLAIFILLKIINILNSHKLKRSYIHISNLTFLYLMIIWVVSYYRLYNSIFLALLISYVFIHFYMNKKVISAGIILTFLVGVKFSHFIGRFFNQSEFSLFGPFRYLISPLPFNYSENYSFLIIISFTATLSFLFYLYGAFIIYKRFSFRNIKYNIIWIWFFVNMFLYSLYRELQGPRHRMQIMFILIIFLIVSLQEIFKRLKIKSRGLKYE